MISRNIFVIDFSLTNFLYEFPLIFITFKYLEISEHFPKTTNSNCGEFSYNIYISGENSHKLVYRLIIPNQNKESFNEFLVKTLVLVV